MQLFLTLFESVPDPRAENVRHDLVEIILIAFLAALCGAQHCSEMAEFGCDRAALVAAPAKGGVIAIDGKSPKGAYKNGENTEIMVSANATGLRLTLATVAAKDRNEVDAALEVIDLKGKIVTADALHCNRRMVEAIIVKGGSKRGGA